MIINPRKLISASTPGAPLAASMAASPTSARGTEQVMVRLRLIGQMEAWTLTTESILPTGRKTRALLAVLALSAPRPVLRGRLAEMLWSRRPEEQARASLRQEIHRLLDALGPAGSQILNITRDHLMLRPGTVWVDVEEVLRASPAKPAALVLLDGDLLEDLDGVDPAFDNWLATERERLRDRARVLAEQMLRDQLEPELAIPAAQQLLSIDRAHEGAWRALMRAYTTRGERGMAIQAYERCRSVLADLLDAQPSEETQRLAAEIRATANQMRPAHASSSPASLRADLVRDLRLPQRQTPDHRTEPRLALLPESRAESRPAPPRAGVRIGVLPLQLLGAENDAHLAHGLADEITAQLSRIRRLSLVSSGSLARFATQTRDEAAIRSQFAIDFLIDGTIQRVADRLRVSLRVLDLREGNQIVWSRRFDRAPDDMLSLQDEIAAEVTAQLDAEILVIESQRAAQRPQAEAGGPDLMLKAMPLIARLEKPLFLQAGDLLRQSLTLDPDAPSAHGLFAQWHLLLVAQGWTHEPAAKMAEAARLADRGALLDPQDAQSLVMSGHVRATAGGRLREALSLHERALQLNPNLASAWSLSGLAHAYAGNLDEAQRRVARYKILTPMHPQAFLLDNTRTVVALMQRDYRAAVAAGREVSEMNPGHVAAYKPYLSALGHLDEVQEAGIIRQRLLALQPDFTLRKFSAQSPFDRSEDLEHVRAGLRRAGIAD
jgi:DNA-binding SARP family transcriptional activator/TolB-like protein